MSQTGLIVSNYIHYKSDFWNDSSGEQLNKYGSCIYMLSDSRNNQSSKYIVTSTSLLKSTKETFAIFNQPNNKIHNIEVESKSIVFIDDYDLAIYTSKDIDVLSQINEVLYEIPPIFSKCTIINNIVKESDEMKIVSNNIECIFKEIKYDTINRFNCPQLPIMHMILSDTNNVLTLESISGSSVLCDNKLIGMVHSFSKKNETVYVIPIYILEKLINNYINKQTSMSLYVDWNEETYHLKNTYDNNLHRGDIIFGINGNPIMYGHLINCIEMNIVMPFDTYIMLHQKEGKIQIQYKKDRSDKTRMEYICLTPLDTITIMPYKDKKYLKWRGLTFVVLTDELIQYYQKLNYNLSGLVMKIYEKKYIDSKIKSNHIVLININWNEISTEDNTQYIINGFPLIIDNSNYSYNSKEKHIIPILYTINNNKIMSLDDIATYGNKNEKCICEYRTNNLRKIIINCDTSNI